MKNDISEDVANDVREDERAAESVRNSQQEEAFRSAVRDAVAIGREVIQQANTAWEQCKEGAIEGVNGKQVEQLCASAANAVGAEHARRLGEGASDIANGKYAEGVQKVAVATAEIAKELIMLREGVLKGTFYETLAESAAENQIKSLIKK